MKLFRSISLITLVSVYLLILVGGIVRSTGAGMGCPDWPKCFGQWVPPTKASELPDDYKEQYRRQRYRKNKRLANYLEMAGFHQLSSRIVNDPMVYEATEFNAEKTWTEYINRLVGALIGVLVAGTFAISFSQWKRDKKVVILSGMAFVLVGVQGWLGSLVVSTNLLPGMITVHMLLALIIVCLLINVCFRSGVVGNHLLAIPGLKFIRGVLWLGISLMVVQVILGTQVREAVDNLNLAVHQLSGTSWWSKLGESFFIHRSFSLVILLVHGILFYRLWKNGGEAKVFGYILMGCIGLSIVSGSLLAYMGLPAYIQPVHLVLASLITGIQFLLILKIRNPEKHYYDYG